MNLYIGLAGRLWHWILCPNLTGLVSLSLWLLPSSSPHYLSLGPLFLLKSGLEKKQIFWGDHTHGQGSNPSHNSDNARSLTLFATRELKLGHLSMFGYKEALRNYYSNVKRTESQLQEATTGQG